MSIQTAKAQITKHYTKLSKAEITSLSSDIQAAMNLLISQKRKGTFSGLSQTEINSSAVLKKGFEARQRLFLANMAYALKKTTQYYKGNDAEGALQESYLGLMRACERYDANTGFAFSTFADLWLKQCCCSYAVREMSSLKIPIAKSYVRLKLQALVKERRANNQPINLAEIAKELKITEDSASCLLSLPLEISAHESTSEGEVNLKIDNIANPEIEDAVGYVIKPDLDPLFSIVYGDLLFKIMKKLPLSDREKLDVDQALKAFKALGVN